MAKTDARLDPALWGAPAHPLRQAVIGNAVLPVFNQQKSALISTLRFGDGVDVFIEDQGWSLIAAHHDGYVGWAKGLKDQIRPSELEARRMRVQNLATHIYPEPNIKTPPVMRLSLGATIDVTGEEGEFLICPQGYVFAAHLTALADDAAGFAAKFLGTPYLWGGGTADGIDCSGLTQICAAMSGAFIPRDTDQQEAALDEIPFEARKRGDLIYWKGHVGLLESPEVMLHATAFYMKTTRENLDEAITRIGPPTSLRRLEPVSFL